MITNLKTFSTMVSELRSNAGWALIKNFIVTPKKVTTRDSFRDVTGSVNGVTAYCIGKFLGDWVIYGLGRNGANTVAWFKLDNGTGGWTTPASSEGNVGARNDNIAFYFENYLYAYGAQKLSRCLPGTSFDPTWYTTAGSWAHVAHPVIVGANAYFAMDNVVYELASGGSTLTTKYTLSADRYVTSLAASGASLSVMTFHEGEQNSREFLFNVAGTDTNAYEQISWGSGTVKHHTEIQSIMLGVVDERTNTSGDDNEASIKLRRRSGSTFVDDAEIKCNIVAQTIGPVKKIFENKLCFKVAYTTPLGDFVNGIMSYAPNGSWIIEVTTDMDANDSASLGFQPFYNSWIIAHSLSGTDATSSVLSAFFSGSETGYDSILETKIIDHDDASQMKKLVGARVSFEPLSSTGSVSLYFRVVGDTEWTLWETQDEEGENVLEVSNSASEPVIPHYKEIQFRIVARNAVLTGFTESSAEVGDSPFNKQYAKRRA